MAGFRLSVAHQPFTVAHDREAMVLGLDSGGVGRRGSKQRASVGRHEAVLHVLGERGLALRVLDGIAPQIGAMRYRKKQHKFSILAQMPNHSRVDHLLKEEAIVQKPFVNMIIGVAIFVQAVSTYLDVDFAHDRGVMYFTDLSMVFCGGVFFIEFFLWLLCYGMDYFSNGWFQFDFAMLVAMAADMYYRLIISGPIADSADSASMYAALRVFRVFRVMKALNQLQFVDGAQQLFMLLSALASSIVAVARVWAIMLPVIWVVALFLTEFGFDIIGQPPEGSLDEYGWFDARAYFGSMGQSVVTLFVCSTRDRWVVVSRELHERDPKMAYALLFGMVILWLVFYNVTCAILVERTIDVAKVREGQMLKHVKAAETGLMREMTREFKEADTSGDAELSWEEFEELMNTKHMVKRLQMLEIPIDDLGELFQMCDSDGGGSITVDEFTTGMNRLKGHATAKDLVVTYSKVRFLLNRTFECMAKVDHILLLLDVIGGRLDEWWQTYENRAAAKHFQLAQRRMCFTRSDIKQDFLVKSEFDLDKVQGWAAEQSSVRRPPPPAERRGEPAPPSGPNPLARSSVAKMSAASRRRQGHA